MLAFFQVTFQLSGARRVRRMLDQLPEKMRRKWLIRGLNAGAGIFKDAIKQSAPRETGLLSRSWKVKKRRYRKRDQLGYIATVKSVRRPVKQTKRGYFRLTTEKTATKLRQQFQKIRYRNPSRYAHLLEYGHWVVRGGRRVAFIRQNNFARRAVNRHQRQAFKAVEAQIRKGINSVRA